MIYINARFLTQRITGVQRYAIEISKRIKKIHPQIKFLSPGNIINEHIANELEVITIGNNKGHLWEQYDLPNYLKKNGSPTLLNLCNTGPLFYKNTIVTIHDLAFLENPSWFSKSFYWFYKTLIPQLAKKAKKIITVSEFSKDEIVRKLNVNPLKVEIIYNAVNILFSTYEDKRRDDFLLYVGSKDPRKNMPRLIAAARSLPHNYRILIVGGAAKSFAESISCDTKNIEFRGYVSDEELLDLYSRAKAFVYPSLYEGFGIPPLEAQAMGVPVLISEIDVFKEVFRDSALYCDPCSIESIAKGLNKIIGLSESQKKELLQKAKNNVDRFSWDQSALKLIKILKDSEIV